MPMPKGSKVPPLQAIYLTIDVNWELTEELRKYKYSESEDQATRSRSIIDIQLLDGMEEAKIRHQLPST